MSSAMAGVSKRVRQIPEALSIYINQLVYSEKRKGIDIITMSLGEAFFDIPRFSFDEIDFISGYHYSDSQGLPQLREKIREYYNRRYGAALPDSDRILISSGSKAILYMIMLLLIEPGDEVLIHEPAWLSYREQVKLAGGVPRFIPYDCKAEDFGRYMNEKTRLLILNNPNNPAGWVYDGDSLKALYALCRKKGIDIVSDEAYSDFIGNDEHFVSMAAVARDLDGVYVVNSLSKNMGMSGWRIGYVLAEKEMILQLLKLNQHIITCAPTVLQMYLARYFDEIIDVTLPQVEEVVEKRRRMTQYMDSIGLRHLEGGSTFYTFIDVSGLQVDTLDFCLYLLFKHGIATVPGGAYGESTGQFIRAGIGAEPEERLKKAFDIIKLVYEGNLADPAYVDRKLKANGFYRFGKED